MTSPDIFDRLFVHFCRHPSFRDALRRSDPIMWRRLLDAATRPPIGGGIE